MTQDLNALPWRMSSFSREHEQCVEVAPRAGGVVLRHSKSPGAGVISFSGGEWSRFIRDARSNRASTNGAAAIERTDDDGATVRSVRDGLELRFTEGEWRAFVSGIRAGEFDFHRAAPADHAERDPSARDAG